MYKSAVTLLVTSTTRETDKCNSFENKAEMHEGNIVGHQVGSKHDDISR